MRLDLILGIELGLATVLEEMFDLTQQTCNKLNACISQSMLKDCAS